MKQLPNSLNQLIQALRTLPSVGPKSAQRMAFHLLERDRNGAADIAIAISNALDKVVHCESCRGFSETSVCDICNDHQRDKSLLCVVESPANVIAIEQSGVFKGQYFVLMGNLSPLDGIGPEEIGLPLLKQRLQNEQIAEVILATGTTVEGEATAHFISEICHKNEVAVSRIAHGIPLGGELDYIDGDTLAHSLAGRRPV